MEVGQPESERVVVLDVHVVGGVIWEGADVVVGVVFAFEDLVVEAVKPLVDPRTVSRKVSRRRLVMGCGVLVCGFLEEIQGFAIVDRCRGGGSISRIDVGIELFRRR